MSKLQYGPEAHLRSHQGQEEMLRKKLRMLPLETALGVIGRMVEETSAALGKEIRVSLSGTDLHLDKFILEGLHDPIVHIVRNAVDHGIETPAERAAKGKDPVGHLDISCAAENGHIIIRIKDDGKGLDYGRVRSRAMEMYPAQAEEIQDMSETRLNAYLFLKNAVFRLLYGAFGQKSRAFEHMESLRKHQQP